MEILTDECVYGATVDLLVSLGHAVQTAKATGLNGADDPDVFAACEESGQVLGTKDRDFVRLWRRSSAKQCGVVVLRIRPVTEDACHEMLQKCLTEIEARKIKHYLATVDSQKFVIRLPDR